jgi:hypothetical protein
MGGIIVMKGGFETGFTMFQLASWSQQTNGDLGMTTANSKWWSKSALVNKKRVVIGSSMYFKRYWGGGGVRYYTPRELDEWSKGDMMPMGIQPDRASLIVVAIPFTEELRSNVIDLRGFFDSDEEENKEFEYHYSTAPYYRKKHGWSNAPRIEYGLALKSKVARPNTVMYQDFQRCFTEEGIFERRIENTGHFGQYAPNQRTKAMRNGEGHSANPGGALVAKQ